MLILVAALSGCGPGVVEPNPVRCEAGPALTIEREPLSIVVEGSGGPTTAELLTLATADGLPARAIWPTLDGSIFVDLGDERVGRLSAELEPTWSRALITEWEHDDTRYAVSEWGVDVILELSQQEDEQTSWHTHIDVSGNCTDAKALVLMGDPSANIRAHVRSGEWLAYAGFFGEPESNPARAAVALVSDGPPSAEVELVAERGYIQWLGLLTGGRERLLAHYSMYEPLGTWGNSLHDVWLDDTLAIVEKAYRGHEHLGYQYDVHGRIHSLWRDDVDYDDQPPPTTITSVRLESPDAPAGEVLERTIPADCEYRAVRVRDDGLQVVQCRDAPQLRGYAGAGPEPVWALTLDDPTLEIRELTFDANGRLWLSVSEQVVLLSW